MNKNGGGAMVEQKQHREMNSEGDTDRERENAGLILMPMRQLCNTKEENNKNPCVLWLN